MIFDKEPSQYEVNGKPAEHPYFLHQYLEIEPSKTISIADAQPASVFVFDGTEPPDWVQRWEPPCEKADLLLISAHADDEQLFFAGLLPYYAVVRGYQVQVAYATDHLSQPVRHHERLDGLWGVGIRNYPVSGGINDLYSESYEQALSNLRQYDISEEDIIAWEKELIARFEPQVIVTHDFEGEYGHGMHRLVSGTLKQAVADAEAYPFLKKVYFHLYDSARIELSCIDQSSYELGGLTPFQITQQKGFSSHKSQHWTWFNRWIYGSDGKLQKASEIERYSPLIYGCFYSAVGEDRARDDIFENVMSYEEQRIAEEKRLEEEMLARERLEAQRLEEAKKARQQKILAGLLAALSAAVILIIIFAGKRKGGTKKERR